MKFIRLARKALRAVINRILSYRMVGPVKLERDGIDESVLEARMPELNTAAEEYFINWKDNFKEEMKKPFLVDDSAAQMLVKLGWIFSELEYCENLTALDFGCGLGWLAHYLNRLGFNTIGLDVSKTSLEYANATFDKHEFYNPLHNYHFLQYDGYKFPISDCSVHYIISFDAFHHVPNQAKILKEMHRALVPGGKLILSEPGTGHAKSEQTKDEVRKFNVLERDTNILDFEEKALAAGFREIFLKPVLCELDIKLPRRAYHKLFKGYVDVNLVHALRNALIVNPMFVCEKEGDFMKSMLHKAHLKADKTHLSLKPGEEFEINVTVENTGQITFQTRYHTRGGYVTIASRLFHGEKKPNEDFGGRILLEKDLLPGEKTELHFKRTAPAEPGEYTLRIEPVFENFYWFSDKDTAPAKIQLNVK
jgi:SAM-dependent methyltransferase